MPNDARRGEIWTYRDTAGNTREVIVVAINGGYCTYLHLSPFTKEGSVKILSRAQRYTCPWKLSYMHTDKLDSFVKECAQAEFTTLLAEISHSVQVGTDDLMVEQLKMETENLKNAVNRMADEVKALKLYKTLYTEFLEAIREGWTSAPKEAAQADKPTVAEAEMDSEAIAKDAKEKELKKRLRAIKQRYIRVRRKECRFKLNDVQRILGIPSATMGSWETGRYEADWERLESVFPGIEAEADEYLKKECEIIGKAQ